MESRINIKFDKWLLLAVLVLLALGVFVIYTGSSHAAMQKGLSPAFYTFVHLKKIAIGLCALGFGCCDGSFGLGKNAIFRHKRRYKAYGRR